MRTKKKSLLDSSFYLEFVQRGFLNLEHVPTFAFLLTFPPLKISFPIPKMVRLFPISGLCLNVTSLETLSQTVPFKISLKSFFMPYLIDFYTSVMWKNNTYIVTITFKFSTSPNRKEALWDFVSLSHCCNSSLRSSTWHTVGFFIYSVGQWVQKGKEMYSARMRKLTWCVSNSQPNASFIPSYRKQMNKSDSNRISLNPL